MATEEKWYFSKDHLNNTPSRQCGIDVYKELFYRQQAANFIQDMGQRLKVSQLCINTATVYMHRFYVFHSFTHFPWHSIAAAALFLSAKVEEQPRKLEHVIRVHNLCENPRDLTFDTQSERYHTQSQDLVFNENVLLQTLGFDVAIDHPHAHVVRCCHLVRASKDLAQTSYFMASTSLHLTTMCLQYKPTVVACFCIHLACKWSNWEIPLSNEKKEWFSYVDSTVTAELLQQLTSEFLVIFERCPSRLKEKIMAIGDGSTTTRSTSHVSSPFESEPRKLHPPADAKDPHHRLHHHEKQAIEDPHKHRSSRPPHESSSSSQQQKEREYREKKERERMAQHGGKPPMPSNSSSSKPPLMAHGHHRPPVDPQKMKPHSRHVMSGQYKDVRDPTMRVNDTTDSKEIQPNKDLVRSDKELDKRAFPMKQPVTDMNSLNNSQQQEHGDKRQQDSSRSRLPNDPKLLQHKQHESARRSHEDQKLNEKKHSSWYDNNKMYDKNSAQHNLKPTTNSTSQRTKSPFAPDTSKSVPKTSQIKSEPHNGSSNGGYGLNLLDDLPIKEEYQQQQKKPSMFSPEKTPPRKSYPTNNKRVAESSTMQSIPAPLSPLDDHLKRSRSSSNSSEGTKKVEQVEGFENILRESSVVKQQQQQQQQHHSVPENILHDNTDSISKELKPPEILAPFNNNSTVPLSQPIVNGIEINPTLISTLLKEAPSVPHLATITSTSTEEQVASQPPPVVENKESKEHHHKDRKKKNKEKHKHKDKSREEKEKKKKHKDKDKRKNKEKSSSEETPIKITISKIQPEAKGGLKIKIPKERLKTDVIGESSQAPVLKLKIPKVVISGQMGSETKKRDREKSSPVDGPPTKFSKTNYKPHGDKQNGQRSSYNKVSNFNNNSTRPHFNNNVPNNTFNAMAPMQNYYYNFPPPPVTQMHSMNVPPPFISYDPNIYGPMYASPYIYPTHGMYPTNQHMVGGGPNIPPPLPDDAPPDVPPPPPPE